MSYGYPNYPGYPPQFQQPARRSATPYRTVKVMLGIFMPLFWVIALFLPAYNDDKYGILTLIFGWSMLGTGNVFAFLAWFANLPFFVGYFVFLLGQKRGARMTAFILGLISFIFSFGALTVSEVVSLNKNMNMSHADASIGLFVWMFALFLLPVGALVFLLTGKSKAQEDAEIQIQYAPPPYPPYPNYPPYPQYPNYPQYPQYPQYPNYQQYTPSPNPNDPQYAPPPDPYQQYLPPNYPPLPSGEHLPPEPPNPFEPPRDGY